MLLRRELPSTSDRLYRCRVHNEHKCYTADGGGYGGSGYGGSGYSGYTIDRYTALRRLSQR